MTADRLRRYARDLVAFIDDLITRDERGRPFRLLPHQRAVLHRAFAFDAAGRLASDTIVYSAPKKSGKTTINAIVVIWWAFTQDSPNEILIVANDFDQAQARVFTAVGALLQQNSALADSADIQRQRIILSNGTTITPIASDYAGAAGSNHGLTSWDELWGYTSESSRRLWEELTPVPTRTNSIRFITSYAGFEGESTLLWNLYRSAVDRAEHPEGRGARLHPDLPIYADRESGLFVYWDHEPRMPWQTPEYYERQRAGLRAGTYLRHHENRWSVDEATFITPELWDPNVDPSLSPLLPTRQFPLFIGVDASTTHDTSAVVAVRWVGHQLALASHRIWRPSPQHPLDLEATIEHHLRHDLHGPYQIRAILCDPYQFHRSITTLKAAGLPIKEFPQTTANATRMGQTLFDLLKGKNLRLYPDEDLRQQALNTVTVDTPRGWRIAKEKASKKIDAIVALAMACVAAIDEGSAPGLQVYAPVPRATQAGWRPFASVAARFARGE